MGREDYRVVMFERIDEIRENDITIVTNPMTHNQEIVTVDSVGKNYIGYRYQFGVGTFQSYSLENLIFFRPSEGKILAGKEAYYKLINKETGRNREIEDTSGCGLMQIKGQ